MYSSLDVFRVFEDFSINTARKFTMLEGLQITKRNFERQVEILDNLCLGTEKEHENSKETKKIKAPAGEYSKIKLYLNKSQRRVLDN